MTEASVQTAGELAMAIARQAAEGITPAFLLEVAVRFDMQYRALQEQFGPGTYHEGRNRAREMLDAALECAAWMERCGLSKTQHVGPFMQWVPQRGDRVRIRKGAHVRGTGNALGANGKVLVRDQVVTVASFDPGYVFHGDEQGKRVRQARIHWAGAGGYWRETDIGNVERVEAAWPRLRTDRGQRANADR